MGLKLIDVSKPLEAYDEVLAKAKNEGREPNTADRMLAMRAAILAYEADKASVIPPTRGTDGQLDAALAALAPFAELADLFDPENRGSNMPGGYYDAVMQWPRLHKNYELTVGHLRNARAVLASRFRAQGGDTKDPGK